MKDSAARSLKLFLAGDVMTGRGVDQILPHSCAPRIYEPLVTSSLDYVALAERRNGPIPRGVDYSYVWGEALTVLQEWEPHVRIINLETSITTSEQALPKGINYRMHPANVQLLHEAKIDCCVLANNHVLDWSTAGLLDTLDTLAAANIALAGAGRSLEQAESPAVIEITPDQRVLVFAFGALDSGIPHSWSATDKRPGVNLLDDFSDAAIERTARLVEQSKGPGDVAIASIHWGGNWGYEIPPEHRRFAHALIDRAHIDLIHGHSAHHAKGIEVYQNHLILYGCGDLLDDYEGISGHEEYRADLVLMYLPELDARTGELQTLTVWPFQLRRFRLERPSAEDRAWLRRVLNREYARFGYHILEHDRYFMLSPN